MKAESLGGAISGDRRRSKMRRMDGLPAWRRWDWAWARDKLRNVID